MRTAMVDGDGIVVTVVETTNRGEIAVNTPDGCTAVPCASEVMPDWRYRDGAFVAPAEGGAS